MVSSTAAAAGAEDEDDGSTRKKLRLTKEQSALLEDRFKEHSTLNPEKTMDVVTISSPDDAILGTKLAELLAPESPSKIKTSKATGHI